MAVRIQDDLADYLGEHTPNDRFDIWLYHHLRLKQGSQIQQTIGGTSDKRRALAEELKRLRIAATFVVALRKAMLLPEIEFDWFVDSKRFFMWFLAQSEKPLANAHTELRYYGSRQLSYREACIVRTDIAEDPLQEKSLKLSDYKLRWQSCLRIGAEFSWVRGENEEDKVRLAFKEIANLWPQLIFPLLSFDQSVPNTPVQSEPKTHEDLLIHIDRILITHPVAKSASKEAKRKWSQLKYRSKKDKRQLNVHIATEAIKKLEAIAAKHDLSKAKVIEYLIKMESEKGLYISEKMATWLRGDVE